MVWRGVYNASTGDLIRSFDALDKQTTYDYERFAGSSAFLPPKVTTITDPVGKVSSIERDEEGNVTEVTGPNGVKRKIEYDSRRRITRVKNAANDVLLRLVYGEQDQILERYDARGKKTGFEYEVFLGVPRLTKVTTPEGKVTDLERDDMGRVTKVTAPSGAEWDYRYVGDWSTVEKITDPTQAETSFEYDARLNPIKETDPLNRITRAIYDDLDLPIEITDALNQKTEFQNNGNRDMKKLTDARSNSYDMAWERRGLRKSLQWPGGDKQQSFFDGNDRLSQWKAKADAGVVTIFRNDAGQVTGRTWTAEPGLSGNVTFGRNSLGQITDTSATVLGETVSQSLGYDAEGRLSSIAQTAASVSRSASVLYDLDGRVTSITYPAGFTVAYDYNDDGQILAIKKDGSLVASYAYDAAGRLSTRTLANGCVTTFGYDAADRLESVTLSSGSNVLWAERYGFNAAGERIYTLHGTTGTVGDGYWLDATSQLRGVKTGSTQAAQPYASQNGAATEWQYDAVGNRLAQTTANTTVTYAAANTSNQYTSISSAGTVAYSERGDLSQLGDWTFSYDAQGNLIRAENSQTSTTAQYWRDAFGHRAVKDVGGNRTVLFNLGTAQIEAYDIPTATASSTIYEPGIDRPLAEVAGNGDVTFYQQDWLGNVVMLTSASGAKVEGYSYDPWGGFTATDSSGTPVATPKSRFLFTAREYDSETGLYHYRARAYCPKLGRFLQTDPIDFDGGDVNLFRYVANRPQQLTDPSGRDYMTSTLAGHAYGTVWDNQGNQTTFDFSPLEGWREYPGGPPWGSVPVQYCSTTSDDDDRLLDEFRRRVDEQPDDYNLFTNNCWQALGNAANPILNPSPSGGGGGGGF